MTSRPMSEGRKGRGIWKAVQPQWDRGRESGERREERQEQIGPKMAPGLPPPGRGVIGFLKQLKNEYSQDNVSVFATALAYRFFLALFPFFIFLAALSGFVTSMLHVQNPAGQILDTLGKALPSNAAQLLTDQITAVITSRNPGLLTFGVIGTIWSASSGVTSLMASMNRAYDVPETRKWWQKYSLAVSLTVLAGAFVIVAFVLLISGLLYATEILRAVGISNGFVRGLITWVRWPVIIGLLMITMAFLYWVCPNTGLPFKLMSPGAVVFTVVWLAATWLFGFYVSNFGSYNATYGALGAVVVILVWLYMSSLLMLLGAEVNAIVDERAHSDHLAEQRRRKRAEAG